jgi:hypothetical protein
MCERFKAITTWLAPFEIRVLRVLIAVFVLSPMLKSGVVEAVSLRRLVKKVLFAGCSKMPRYKAPEILRSGVATNKERHLATPPSW